MTTRRKFLKDTAMLSAGIALYGCSDAKGGVFSPSERECLISMSEQIVPADKIYGGANGRRRNKLYRKLGLEILAGNFAHL